MLSTKSDPERILKDYRAIQKYVSAKHTTGTSENLTIQVEYLSDSSSSSSQNLSPISQIPVIINMVAAAPVNPMNAIIAARYAPLVLPQVLHDLPTNDYLKYLPKFNGEGEVTAEEHLSTFYAFADNLGIEHEDVWMRLFAQSLDGEVRKWFRALTVNSIGNILDLDVIFLRKWGEKKDNLCYITEFNNLKRKPDESFSDFTQRFNRMYQKIPTEIKPAHRLAKVTYANSFDAKFCLLLRERISVTIANM